MRILYLKIFIENSIFENFLLCLSIKESIIVK